MHQKNGIVKRAGDLLREEKELSVQMMIGDEER